MHVPKRQKISRLANDAPQLLERCQRIDFGGAAFKPTQFIIGASTRSASLLFFRNREGLYKLFEDQNTDAISACYHRQIMPQTRISKWNWLNFTITKLLMMVILVVELFICVDVDKFSTGKIYAIVSYWWSFILSTKYLPGLMESVTSLIELNGRLSQQDTGIWWSFYPGNDWY